MCDLGEVEADIRRGDPRLAHPLRSSHPRGASEVETAPVIEPGRALIEFRANWLNHPPGTIWIYGTAVKSILRTSRPWTFLIRRCLPCVARRSRRPRFKVQNVPRVESQST